MRLSLPRCHDQYLKTLAEQMNCSPNEALTYLIWEVRRQGFSFASPLSLPIAQTATQPQTAPVPIGKFVPFEEIVPEGPDEVIRNGLTNVAAGLTNLGHSLENMHRTVLQDFIYRKVIQSQHPRHKLVRKRV